jgi:hypothetical protein
MEDLEAACDGRVGDLCRCPCGQDRPLSSKEYQQSTRAKVGEGIHKNLDYNRSTLG